MDELARGFAEFLGELLAEQWLREQQAAKAAARTHPESPDVKTAAQGPDGPPFVTGDPKKTPPR